MPTSARRLATEIRSYCRTHADPAQKDKYARYFKEGYDTWGLLDSKHPIWTEMAPRWTAACKTMEEALELGTILLESPKYEEGSVAILILKAFRTGPNPARLIEGLDAWFAAGIRNWAHTDVLCGEIVAPLLREGRVPLAALSGWRTSPHRFQRRAVPVSMLGLLKTGCAVIELLDFIRPMMADAERVVHQGLGWFLRETWKKEAKPVEALLLEYRDSAARLIFQYACEKMTPKARERFRRQRARPATPLPPLS